MVKCSYQNTPVEHYLLWNSISVLVKCQKCFTDQHILSKWHDLMHNSKITLRKKSLSCHNRWSVQVHYQTPMRNMIPWNRRKHITFPTKENSGPLYQQKKHWPLFSGIRMVFCLQYAKMNNQKVIKKQWRNCLW